nr:hypothetical protein [Tanacetum cinerariifolium]
ACEWSGGRAGARVLPASARARWPRAGGGPAAWCPGPRRPRGARPQCPGRHRRGRGRCPARCAA